MNKVFHINDIRIGANERCFIVAEIGLNHNGDIKLAKESIHAAAEAGADSVKFQNYYTEDFIFDRSLSLEYISQGSRKTEPQYDLFKRCELNLEQLLELKATCDSCGVIFHSTPTSKRGISDLIALDCKILKNGSDYLTNTELIRAMGESGLLTVLSTGMATLSEIDLAVAAFRETGNQKLLLLHCTSSYPTPSEDTNLSRIGALASAFGTPVGFSDHTEGIVAAVGAVVMGACWIEKHFTIDKNLPGPDHWFSMTPDELKQLVLSVRKTESMIGKSEIIPTESEKTSRSLFRLSCVATRDISAGEMISSNDIGFKRPGNGLPPAYKPFLVGRQVVNSVREGEHITEEHFRERAN